MKYIRLQSDYKMLLSEVSHDISTPLNYLKLSTDILQSQIDPNADPDLKETVRVISSSTSKLNEEAQQIVEHSKSKLKAPETPSTVKTNLLFSSALLGIKLNPEMLQGRYETVLKKNADAYKYLFSALMQVIRNLELDIHTIAIEKCQNDLNVKLDFFEHSTVEVLRIKREVSTMINKELLSSVMNYLKAEILISKGENKSIRLNLILSL